jgi:hypothetical protein
MPTAVARRHAFSTRTRGERLVEFVVEAPPMVTDRSARDSVRTVQTSWVLVGLLLSSASACSSSSGYGGPWCYVAPSSGTNEQCRQSTPALISSQLDLGDGTSCPSNLSSWQSGECPTANLYGCCVGPGNQALCYYDVTAVTGIVSDCPMQTPGAVWQQTVP